MLKQAFWDLIKHDLSIQYIGELERIFTAPVDMQEAWEKTHAEYVEKSA